MQKFLLELVVINRQQAYIFLIIDFFDEKIKKINYFLIMLVSWVITSNQRRSSSQKLSHKKSDKNGLSVFMLNL